MTEENKPKIFISYSWAVKDWTVNLATRLVNDGIETKVDFWDLKEGHDKYTFMESMVKDESIDYVLIICDTTYTEKADGRQGGVGEETVIISSELYGKTKQTKFLPLILNKDENGNAISPVYIKSKIHFDFSDKNNYENEYEKLLRCIYNQPVIPKPKLGTKPEWLKKDAVSVSSLAGFISVLKSANNEARKNAAIIEFHQEFSKIAKEFCVDTSNAELEFLGKAIAEKIDAMKPLRDAYLDFLKEIILSEREIVDFVCLFFETVYNDLMLVSKEKTSWYESSFEHYQFLIWESFVCTIVYLRYYEKYKEIHAIITHTYYLQENISSVKKLVPWSFLKFRCSCRILDDYGEKLRLISLTADTAVKRIKEPLITKESFSETDIFLCQMSFSLKIRQANSYWFPLTYIYADNLNNIWIKLSSRQYCKKILPLFGVETIDELKKIIQENPVKDGYGFQSAWYPVPKIPLKIGDDDFASLS